MAGAISQFETMSLDDFEELLLDKPDDERWELINGRVVRGMVGARWEHERIAGNLYVALQNHFRAKGSPCRAFKETFYVKKKISDFAVLPDVVVRCGAMVPGATSVADPSVVFEILSPGTEGRDPYEKWDGYRDLGTLQHYVLVSRDKPLIEVRTRAAPDWRIDLLEGADRILRLPAIDFEMAAVAVYEDVLPA